MRAKIIFLLIFAGYISNSYSWTPDSTKLLWNRDFIIESEFGYSYVNMGRLNNYYIDDWAKDIGLFHKPFHSCTFFSPSFGLIFTDNVISVSGTISKSKIKSDVITTDSYTPYLFLDSYTLNISYRKLLKVRTFLIGIGSTVSFGKSSADIETDSFHEMKKQEGQLSEGFGGGGSIFAEANYIFLKYVIFGFKVSGNLFFTETLKSKDLGKWIVDANGEEINLDYSGISGIIKVGLLW